MSVWSVYSVLWVYLVKVAIETAWYQEVESEFLLCPEQKHYCCKQNRKRESKRARAVQVGTVVCEYTVHLLCDFEGFSSWHTRSVTQNLVLPVWLSKLHKAALLYLTISHLVTRLHQIRVRTSAPEWTCQNLATQDAFQTCSSHLRDSYSKSKWYCEQLKLIPADSVALRSEVESSSE